jgi:long-chain acyl-CoA synthetase
MAGQLVLTGRAKDTVVLAGGENVSPQPIEDNLSQSPIIKHAMVFGQDKRTLGVLVSLDKEAMQQYLKVCHFLLLSHHQQAQ